MNSLKIKTDKHGICKEFTINGTPLGSRITKLTIIIEPGNPTKLIMETIPECNIIE